MIAAALLYILPEMLRELDVQKYRMLIYAVLLIAVMLITNNEKIRALAGRVFKKKAGKEA
jgi:branched-chain amino acid transport system permease protein